MKQLQIYNPYKKEIVIAPISAFTQEGISTYATISLEAFNKNLEDRLAQIPNDCLFQ
jgi:hypothetical protein